MNEEPTTQELRLRQQERERAAREQAERVRGENDTAQFDRRADKAAYLREKLEERAKAERKKAKENPSEQGEKAADDMERRSERLSEEIDEARGDWEAKKGDERVPGAQPEQAPDRGGEEGPPPEADVTPGD